MGLSNDALGERIKALEVRQDHMTERLVEDRTVAARDRAELKQQIADARSDIAALRKDLAEVSGAWQSALDQIKGGRRALHALYIVGAGAAAVAAWGTGLLKWMAGLPIR